MKKNIFLISVFVISFLIGCSTCGTRSRAESEFNFIFKYGTGARNILNTFNGEFTKDMVLDDPITIDFILTNEEMKNILAKMKEIKFFDYPQVFSIVNNPDDIEGFVTPYNSYYFKVRDNSKTKELFWEDKIINKDEKADKLRALIKFIISTIKAKEEYKKLPPARDGYL